MSPSQFRQERAGLRHAGRPGSPGLTIVEALQFPDRDPLPDTACAKPPTSLAPQLNVHLSADGFAEFKAVRAAL
jgi:hypothetical protein